MQCVSLLKDKSRCPNNKVGLSYHCDLHRGKAKNLYLKYKKLQKECEDLDLNIETVENIELCYIRYNRLFKAREKHRQYAFSEEYWDEGHNYQFTKLLEKMEQCEIILERLYNLNNKFDNKTIEDEEELVMNIAENRNLKPIEYWKQYREKLKIESNLYIEKCIEENRLYTEEHDKLVYYVRKNLLNLFYDDNNFAIFFYDMFLTKDILRKMQNTKFSQIRSFPEIQSHCKCNIGNYDKVTNEMIPFDDIVLQTIIVLVCKFIEELIGHNYFETKYTFKATLEFDENYISNLNNIVLRNIFNLLIHHKVEIQYLIKEIIFSIVGYYDSGKSNFLFLEGHLLMDGELEEFMFVTEDVNKKYIFRDNEDLKNDNIKLKRYLAKK